MNARRGGPAEAQQLRMTAAAEQRRIAAAAAEQQRLAAAATKVNFYTTDLLNFLASIILVH